MEIEAPPDLETVALVGLLLLPRLALRRRTVRSSPLLNSTHFPGFPFSPCLFPGKNVGNLDSISDRVALNCGIWLSLEVVGNGDFVGVSSQSQNLKFFFFFIAVWLL